MLPIEPTAAQRRLLERHLDELQTWNRRLNLTAVPRDRAWVKHVEESLALLEAAAPAAGSLIADLGSGGGIPGVVVAVMRPDVAVTLIESDQRKAGFLVHVAGLLELDNLTVAARRAEALGRDPEHRERYDGVVSRAAAPAALLVELAMPLLRPGASLWALVSDAPASARAATAAGASATAPAAGILAVAKR
ncbi:MAG TPA: 16S rRNA (guanine(527)-N(7))-methyltransferase RsmG [Candidatus Dormibacteraeota bacterium]|nr:16S rRNA (guanine(527)-N(7))-methyltransferase RsmG [Candidatus Dormibacteraeota bacterium]